MTSLCFQLPQQVTEWVPIWSPGLSHPRCAGWSPGLLTLNPLRLCVRPTQATPRLSPVWLPKPAEHGSSSGHEAGQPECLPSSPFPFSSSSPPWGGEHVGGDGSAKNALGVGGCDPRP